MDRRAILLGSAIVLACGATAPARAGGETISIDVRPAGDVCLGTCQHFALIISSTGAVTTRDFPSGSGKVGARPRGEWHFRISPADYVRIRRALAPVRPAGESRDPASCDKAGKADSAAWRPDTRRYDIRWRDARGESRRVGCDWQGGTGVAFDIVMKTLRLSPGSGRPSVERH